MRRDDDTSLPSVERLGDELDQAFTRAERIESAARERPASRRVRPRRRLLIPVLAVALVICVISAAAISVSGRRDAPLTTQQALAEVARSTISVPLPNSRQFLYTHSEQISAGSSRSGRRDHLGRRLGWMRSNPKYVDDLWSSSGLCGLQRLRETGRDYPTERDRELSRRYDAENLFLWRRANRRRRARGLQPLPQAKLPTEMVFKIPADDDLRFGDETLTPAQLRRFPEEPRAIYKRVHRVTATRPTGSSGDGASNDLNTVIDALGSKLALHITPAARAGMVNSLAYVVGVKSLGRMADPKGRVGYGFGLENRGIRTTVIFDDASGYPVFRRDEVLKARDRGFYQGWPAGSVIHQRLVLERKIVDRLPRGLKATVSSPGLPCR